MRLSDSLANEQTDGPTDGQADGPTDGQADGPTDGQAEQTERRTNGKTECVKYGLDQGTIRRTDGLAERPNCIRI